MRKKKNFRKFYWVIYRVFNLLFYVYKKFKNILEFSFFHFAFLVLVFISINTSQSFFYHYQYYLFFYQLQNYLYWAC